MENARPDAGLSGVASGMQQVDALLAEVVQHDDPFIAEASAYLMQAGGKRFRPQLALLVSGLGDGPTPEVVKAAAAVELVHLASLYHDGDHKGIMQSSLKALVKHPLTDKGLDAFVSDWAKTGQSIL